MGFAAEREERWRYRGLVAAIYAVVAILATAIAYWEIAQVNAAMATLARERGSVLFKLIELTRDWNAQHGGVYVPVTEKTQPNPYLKHPRRDLVTQDGVALTLINPAFMTRQIAEIAEKAEGVKFHITSLDPIRPANLADAWEAESLRFFEQRRVKERLSFFKDGNGILPGPAHRYIAPLIVKQACMKCHASQGYQVGDIRGGISVTMPAEKLMEIGAQQRRNIEVLYLGAFLIVAGLGHLVAWHMRRYVGTLETINRNQEAVIAERTGELSVANAALQNEIADVAAAHREMEESEARYRAVVESSQDGIVVLRDDRMVLVNDRLAAIVGYAVEDLLATDLCRLVVPEDRAIMLERRRQLADEMVPGAYRIRLLHKDGVTRRTVDVYSVPQRDLDGTYQAVISLKDVTEKLTAERELQIAAAVFAGAAEAIMVTDRDKRIVQVNPAFSVITGFSATEAVGHRPSLLKSGRHEAAYFHEMWRHLQELGRWEGEVWNRHKNGHVYAIWLTVTTIHGDGEGAGRYLATFIDITKRKEAEAIVLHRANYDALTNLANRHLFEDRLDSALATARRHKRGFALMYIDLDFFKAVNDSLGHGAGDQLLIEAAHRMEKCVRAVDTVARLGGDEFAVLLTELDNETEADEVARRLNDALAQPYVLPEGTATATGSIGIAVYPRDGGDELQLQRGADEALYAAKAAGRNTYRYAG